MEYTKYCKCGCNNGVILKFDKDDDTLYLSLVSDNYYTHQENTFLERLKRIWCIIAGKEYCYFEISMDENDVADFKDFVLKLN